MKYTGKVYAKINGRYLECTQTVDDLENKIKELESQLALYSSLLFTISKGCNPS